MLSDAPIASTEPHITHLAFTEIFEYAIGAVTVSISVLKSLFACDDNHHRMLRRRYDAALLLSTEAGVNVEPPIVNAANLKSPAHHCPLFFAAWPRRYAPLPTLRLVHQALCASVS
jgi:hypothetical protein